MMFKTHLLLTIALTLHISFAFWGFSSDSQPSKPDEIDLLDAANEKKNLIFYDDNYILTVGTHNLD